MSSSLKRNFSLSGAIALHEHWVHGPRVRALCLMLEPLLNDAGSVADIGCGDGLLTARMAARLPRTVFSGYDVRKRDQTSPIDIRLFDGAKLPLENASVDAIMLIDVLHHAKDPFELLKEACRVTRSRLVIKDHRLSKWAARPLLTFMDWAGNGGRGVESPAHYWSEREWASAWNELELEVIEYRTRLNLYPRLMRPLFEDGLHFLAVLEKKTRL